MRIGIHFAAFAALAGAFGCATQAPPARNLEIADAPSRCAALAGAVIPASAFDLPTGAASLTETVLIEADAASGMPAYCRVRGAIAAVQPGDPSILFQVNLPTSWNLKSVQYGGGGLNGVVIQATGPFAGGRGGDVAPALARGYVTYGSDSGHQGADASFYGNAQAFANYSHEAVKRSFDLASAVIDRYYGRAARRNYHIGGSKGGQEGLQAAQRYYADFDGIVSYYPAAQNQSLSLSWNRMWHTAFNTPGGALNTAEQALLESAVMRACDGLDGAEDGIVSDLPTCSATFDVASLRCAGGVDGGDACLSDPQIAALNDANRRFTFAHPMPNGVATAGPWPVFNGGDIDLWFGTGEANSQQAFFRWPAAPPEALHSSGIPLETWQANVLRVASIYDASNPNIDGFRARGGKLILVQGTTDFLVPPSMTDAYHAALSARYGAGLGGFVRYYVMPGYGHGNGAFMMQWDSLEALDQWVEHGRAPVSPIASDANAATRGRTRPLCEYPTWPRYNGGGDINHAESYSCTAN